MSTQEETGTLKIKKKSLKRKNDATYKVKLKDKKEEDAIPIGETKKVDVGERSSDGEGVQQGGEGKPTNQEGEINPIKEITKEEISKSIIKQIKVPENLTKLVGFMQETGGSLEDYVRLNADYSTVDENVLLYEYYKKTKPHLTTEEIQFTLEDQFDVDEDIDEERNVKKKNLAKKEEIAKAKNFLESLKEEYYAEIKLNSNVPVDNQEAVDFFNRYTKEQDIARNQHEEFQTQTNEYFNPDFEGFDFKVGDKKYKYGVRDPKKVAENQSSLNTFIGKFLDKDGSVNDHQSYHKAIYSAQNIDTIVEHFYEQGKADAIKDITARSNNVKSTPRSVPSGDVTLNGWKVKAISGVDSSRLKIKKHN
jgi:hypothetical protein